jgi:hypothetical protein
MCIEEVRLSSQFGVSRMNDKQVELLSKTLLAVERDMDMNEIPLSLSVLERPSGASGVTQNRPMRVT